MRSDRDLSDRSSDRFVRSDALGRPESSFNNDPFHLSADQSTARATERAYRSLVTNEPNASSTPLVKVYSHEQLAAQYDDVSNEGEISIEGTIYVQAMGPSSTPFCIVLRDLLGQIDRIEERVDVCCDITDRVSSRGLHSSDRILRISLNSSPASPFRETIVLKYFCIPTLRPVPLLVKSRVQQSREHTRVGFKIRANPSNQFPLYQIMIIMAVPPNMDGESVRLSRPGGVWDEMKRTIAWSIKYLQPGEALEIQAQFSSMDGNGQRSGSFPILVRTEYPRLFSAVEVVNEYWDAVTPAIQLETACAGRLLHRKV
ncbi:hypothetical protein FisN_1Lh607 [Fistulifera solaris]|uniref:MHD domain-containing protein n=1 Tax=Fistulifera solaris TaxID=1519565 RepID=A0A1Z5K0V0_FISSO|nr:hypothetical protein FisN_1Lh607 [Fistulifera solaris]|eukprot:GAX19924.1 hypothetical protein FisN_1Lh607 [Fistulifera solaris]